MNLECGGKEQIKGQNTPKGGGTSLGCMQVDTRVGKGERKGRGGVWSLLCVMVVPALCPRHTKGWLQASSTVHPAEWVVLKLHPSKASIQILPSSPAPQGSRSSPLLRLAAHRSDSQTDSASAEAPTAGNPRNLHAFL